jgi:branched-chain amino acid transport system permease protein
MIRRASSAVTQTSTFALGCVRYLRAAGIGTRLLVLAAVTAPLVLPVITPADQYWEAVLVKMGIAVMLALGLNVVVGLAGLLDLGYVAFFAVGAYTFAILSGAAEFSLAQLAQDPAANDLLPTWEPWFWLLFFVAMGLAAVAGVLLGAPALRLRGDYLAIVTLGFGEIVRISANNLEGFTAGPWGITQIPHPVVELAGFRYAFGLDSAAYYWLTLGIIAIWIVLLGRLNRSWVGRAWIAIREDEGAAAASGVAILRMKLLAFAIGAAVASFGGVIYATQVSFISPDTFSLFNPAFGSVTILAMVVLGGMGSIRGPILGACLIIFLPEWLRFLGDARLLALGVALVLVMILRPQGLVPSRRREAELTSGSE